MRCDYCGQNSGDKTISAANRSFCSDICHLHFWKEEMPGLGGSMISEKTIKGIEQLKGRERQKEYDQVVLSILDSFEQTHIMRGIQDGATESRWLEIPQAMRAMFNRDGVAYITRGFSNTLRIYPKREWFKLKKSYKKVDENNTLSVSFSRFMVASIFCSKVDLNHKIEIPEYLYAYLGTDGPIELTHDGDSIIVSSYSHINH